MEDDRLDKIMVALGRLENGMENNGRHLDSISAKIDREVERQRKDLAMVEAKIDAHVADQTGAHGAAAVAHSDGQRLLWVGVLIAILGLMGPFAWEAAKARFSGERATAAAGR